MGFFDLNIPYYESDRHVTDKSSLRGRRLKLVLKAMELGYTGVAYNRTLKGVMSETDRCSTPLMPLSKLTQSSSSFFAAVKFHRELLSVPLTSPFRQYTRLTVIVDNPSQASALNAGNPILKSYDIVAVRPMNQNAFDQACQTSEVDMIAIDFSEKLPFRLKQPMVKAAIKRGVYFEITYSGLIADAQSRQNMTSNCKILVDWTRGKNLIVCSSAPSANELRGPQDVSNLLSLLGLSMERAKAAISKNCRSLLANALRKKHFYKDAVKVEEMPSGGEVNLAKSTFDDWLKWDPISSGEGDLLLDDMEKSFAIFHTVTKNVKANFTSYMNGLPAHGLQIKDLICPTNTTLKPAATDISESADMTSAVQKLEGQGADLICLTNKAVELPDTDIPELAPMEADEPCAVEKLEDQGALDPLHEEQNSMSGNQAGLSTLNKEQDKVILQDEGQTSSSGVTNVYLASGCRDLKVSLNSVPKCPVAVVPLAEEDQIPLNDPNIGYQASSFEDSAMSSLPTYNGTYPTKTTISISHEKLICSNDLEKNIFASETQLQDIQSQMYEGNDIDDAERVGVTDIITPAADTRASIELSTPLNLFSSSTFQLEESNIESQGDIVVYPQECVGKDEDRNRIDIENHQQPSLASNDASSQDIYLDGGHHTEIANNSVKFGDDLPVDGSSNCTTDFDERILDDVMGEGERIKSDTNNQGFGVSQTGRERRRRSSPHLPFLFPFKRSLKSMPFKRKSCKRKLRSSM